MNGKRRVALVLTAAISLAAAVPQGRTDELVTFDATPTEYAWRAVQSYATEWNWSSELGGFKPVNPIEWRDVYQLPTGMALDVDGDGVEEVLLAIIHPAACDVEGCDVLLLEGDVPDHGTARLRLDDVLHLPITALGSARILIMDDDFVFLEQAPRPPTSLMWGLEIDGESAADFISERYGQVVFDRLDSEDVGFAEIDLNGDSRPEVIVAIDVYTNCGNRDDCGGGIISPDPEDTLGPYPWRWRYIGPLEDGYFRPDWSVQVAPGFVRGWRVLRFKLACWAWYDGRYRSFRHATFRLIPIQGCFD